MEKEIYLSIKNLHKFFGKKEVIHDLSFDLYSGEILGFLGPNGAGKSTTIKMIMGFLSVDHGKIYILGKDQQKDYEASMAEIGGIVENPEMYFNLSGRLNLEMYRRLHPGIPVSRINEVITLLRMENRADEKVKTYSLGMKQRICIAQALLHKPKVLILDEPTNGLDPAGIHELRDLLIDLSHEKGMAVLISSHQLSEIQKICDRVIIIDKGRLIENQSVNHLIKQTEKNLTIIKFLNTKARQQAMDLLSGNVQIELTPHQETDVLLAIEENQIPEIIFRLSQAHLPIISVCPYQTNLEEIYLSVTEGGTSIE